MFRSDDYATFQIEHTDSAMPLPSGSLPESAYPSLPVAGARFAEQSPQLRPGFGIVLWLPGKVITSDYGLSE